MEDENLLKRAIKKPEQFKKRVYQACEEALSRQGHISPIDVLVGVQLLHPNHVEYWRKGKIPSLEEEIQGSVEKILFCFSCFHEWVKERDLKPSSVEYLATLMPILCQHE